ncbi:MAG: hypothetical protein SWH68_06750 [Thermodesulfobacteriota bacterium]|nr:hypothetical protein [Thermodesulfobacteriota bacterium]
MFFIGIYTAPDNAQTGLVIIDKFLKNIKHHYRLVTAWEPPLAGIEKTIADHYNNPSYMTRKRVFSQDKRPAKDVNAHPTLIMASLDTDKGSCRKLRDEHIPVEYVRVTQNPAVTIEEPGKAGVGRDFSVPETAFGDTLQQVLQQKRLCGLAENLESIPTALQDFLSQAVNSPAIAFPAEWPATASALAAILWFRENNRYTRTYRTSSTRTRRFG